MKLKSLLICIVFIILLTGCSNKEEKLELNFETDIFSAYVNKNLIDTRIHEENTLIFEPKDDDEYSFISVKAKEETNSENECMNYLINYKNELEEKGNKITVINQETIDGISSLNYSVLSKNGTITTIYSKALSSNNYTIMVSYYCSYSDSEQPNLTLKNTYDSITIK